MSQRITLSQRINQLCFGVDVTNQSISIVDSLRSLTQLHYNADNARNLDIIDNIWTSTPYFTFTESPLPDLKIKEGTIRVKLGWKDSDSIGKVLELNWYAKFSKNSEAKIYFEKLKQLFEEATIYKKFEHDKKEGDAAYFTNSNQNDKKKLLVALFLFKSLETKKYEVSFSYSNDFMDE
ncbi:MAG: hypothetical protein PW786_11950 [Arachidicoccus sp.]|nr:hypothetical protein [Arachidicoccus sp.]